jgi:hypothetical protein
MDRSPVWSLLHTTYHPKGGEAKKMCSEAFWKGFQGYSCENYFLLLCNHNKGVTLKP